MIARYSRPEMEAVWTNENKFRSWLRVEMAVCKAWNRRGKITDEHLDQILTKADFDVDRVLEIEETVRHDVIAFLTNVGEYVGPSSRFIHLGMTSSDMLDTALALQIKDAGEILLKGCKKLLAALADKAIQYKMTPAVGRTHGIHAEPVSFGLRFARFYEQLKRATHRLDNSWQTASVGKLSGAVGCYVHLDPEMEEEVMEGLGLGVAPISSQVVSRDRHADFLAAVAMVAAVLECIALEVRHLQRTEVGEAREGFKKGQKGSSAMPHKRNPIDSEKICGLSRLLRGYMHTAYEDIGLWHERDISHSSVERVILPDATIALDYLLHLTLQVVQNLYVDEVKIRKNLELTGGAVFTEGVLLALIDAGLTREQGYAMVQKVSQAALDGGIPVREAALASQEILDVLGKDKVESLFDVHHALRNVDFIYKRLGLDSRDAIQAS